MIKGHASNPLNINCDAMAALHHTHYPQTSLQLQTTISLTIDIRNESLDARKVHSEGYFRIRHLIYAAQRKRLLPTFTYLKNSFQQEIMRLSIPIINVVPLRRLWTSLDRTYYQRTRCYNSKQPTNIWTTDKSSKKQGPALRLV